MDGANQHPCVSDRGLSWKVVSVAPGRCVCSRVLKQKSAKVEAADADHGVVYDIKLKCKASSPYIPGPTVLTATEMLLTCMCEDGGGCSAKTYQIYMSRQWSQLELVNLTSGYRKKFCQDSGVKGEVWVGVYGMTPVLRSNHIDMIC